MEQNTGSWLLFRQGRIGASDAPIIMGVSPYQTPHGLWRDKKGMNTNPNAVKGKSMNWAIDRGNRFEPIARARYELINDIPMDPAVLLHPEHEFLMASLDGWNEEKKRVLEIKIPGREVFDAAKSGKVHEKYVYQLEHQLLVSSGEEVHFYCCKVEVKNGREQIIDDALVVYKSDSQRREILLPKLFEFWGYMQRDEPPPITDRDALELHDHRSKCLFERVGISFLKAEKLHNECDKLEAKKPDDLSESRWKDEIEDLTELCHEADYELFNAKKDVADLLTHPRVRSGWVELKKNKRFKNHWDVKIVGEMPDGI